MLKEVECAEDSCANGGICRIVAQEVECLCQKGFYGGRCEGKRDVNVNAVIEDRCFNVTCPLNAICVEGIDSHRCICQPGFTGSALPIVLCHVISSHFRIS